MREQREVSFWVSDIIGADLEKLGALSFLRPGTSFHKHRCANGGEYYVVPRRDAYAVYEEVVAQNSINRGREGSGVTRSYCKLVKDLERELGLDFGSRLMCRPDPRFCDRQDREVAVLFYKLGIPEVRDRLES